MPSAPKIHLVRHAQGFHNLGSEFHSLPDPRLTPFGESQCSTLQSTHFPPERQASISLVTASPLSRTLHTAFLTFSPALSNGKCPPRILAIPDAQETSDYPCDTGSDLEVLHGICAEQGWPADLSLVTEDWNIKTLDKRYSPATDAIKLRAHDTRLLLRQKARELAAAGHDTVEIVLVTHGGYLHYLTNDWEDADKHSGTGWENCEYRTYEFEASYNSDRDEEAYLRETKESRARRGKEHAMLSRERQRELFQRMMQGWEDQGLQNPSKLGMEESERGRKEPISGGQDPARQVSLGDDVDVDTTLNALAGEVKVTA